eukprot:m.18675 g.18675  ORF g.18675 m.18675 type:complete len:340 (-) comp6380_c0_seq1:85-1104(-)
MDVAEQLLFSWDKLANDDHGPFRTKFADFQVKPLQGSMGMVVEYNPLHWQKKRKDHNPLDINPNLPDVPVDKPFNPDKFNFNKINNAECLFSLQLDESEVTLHRPTDTDTSLDKIIINVSPLFSFHALLVPHPSACTRQVLTLRAVCGVFRLMASFSSSKDSYRVLFNSLGAFSSVNHQHFHLVSLAGSKCSKFPIEERPVKEVHKFKSGTIYSVEEYACRMWKLVTEKDDKNAINHMTELIVKMADYLREEKIAFNMLVTSTYETFLIPRQNQAVQERTEGYRMAVVELAGIAICSSDEEWDTIEETAYLERMRETTSIPHEQFAKLTTDLIKFAGHS